MTRTLPADPFTAVHGDRHAAYAALAARGPVHEFVTPSGTTAYLVTDYDEVRRALTDRRAPYTVSEPVRLGGVEIPAGAVLYLGLLAANRDPARVTDPDTFDVTRVPGPHLAFGHGVHHCLGAPLARLEGAVAFRALLARFPGLRLAVPAAELTWLPNLLMNGLTALPVEPRSRERSP